MPQTRPRNSCDLGIAFIDAQLLTLCAYASLLADWIETGEKAPDLSATQRLFAAKRSDRERDAHSEDGMPTKSALPARFTSWPELSDASQRMAFALRVPSTNAIVAAPLRNTRTKKRPGDVIAHSLSISDVGKKYLNIESSRSRKSMVAL